MDLIVLGYSGSLDTSVAIPWLAEKYRAEVVTVTLDFGQGREVEEIRERALAIGAARAHVLDLRDTFASHFILPALQAGAFSEGRTALGRALTRPLIAKHLLEVARVEGAGAIAHGGSSIDGLPGRVTMAARALDPSIQSIAVSRVWKSTPAKRLEYARLRGIPTLATAQDAAEANLWGRTIDATSASNDWQEPAEDLFLLTKRAEEAPGTPAYVEIEFARGVPTRINGVEMSLAELIQCLETIVGSHGVGRIDVVEPRVTGETSRTIVEAPAAVALDTAHRDLQAFVTRPDLARIAAGLGTEYADLIATGQWFSQTREALDGFVSHVQQRVSGVVRLKIFKGDCRVVGRRGVRPGSDQGQTGVRPLVATEGVTAARPLGASRKTT
jgi:argininosuccinate synthase